MTSDRQKERRRLRLAHVITGLELGGGGAVVLTIARALDRTRFDMDVFCILEGGAGEAELRALGCGVTILERAWDYRRRVLSYSPTKTLELSRLLRAGRYDVVHTHLFPADVIGRIAGRLAGIPVSVKSLHNMGGWKTRRHLMTDRLLASWTDRVICCSDFQKSVAATQEKLADDAAVTIHHGVRLSRFEPRIDRPAYLTSLGLRADRLTIGTVGRPIPEKGHRYLLDAMPHIVASHPDVQFLIVGDGALRPELESRTATLGLTDRVRFVGARPDVPELLAAMDIFVFPSVSEGFGIAVVEAMASRLPVVASNVGPLPEIVIDGDTGALVPTADGPALAAAVNRLIDDEHLRRQLALAGRARVEARFTDRHMVGTLESLYINLYQASAARRGQLSDPLLCQ